MLIGLLNNFCQWTTWPVSPLLLQWAVLPAYFIYSSFTPTTEIVRVSTQVFSPDPGPQCWWQMFTSLPVPQEQFQDKTCRKIKMFWSTIFKTHFVIYCWQQLLWGNCDTIEMNQSTQNYQDTSQLQRFKHFVSIINLIFSNSYAFDICNYLL